MVIPNKISFDQMEPKNYNLIARDYNIVRKKPWNHFEQFLDELRREHYAFDGVLLDLGCANGRHFKTFKSKTNKIVGLDNSMEFLKIAQENVRDPSKFTRVISNNIALVLGDALFLPFRAPSLNGTFSVAMIHHIKGKEQRKSALDQIYQILIKKGFLIFTVWRRWQKKFRFYFIKDDIKRALLNSYKHDQRRKSLLEQGDKLVPWRISQNGGTYDRFYHFFTKKEIKKLLRSFDIVRLQKAGGSTREDNFFVMALKK